ncbi:MAG TPA: amidohydrolase family protein [Cyclobacteriaceae bacterium]
MQKIDSHQHFWNFDPKRDAWITEDMAAIRRDFGPEDLRPVYDAHGVEGCVAVQADQSQAENDFLLGLAEHHEWIKGVVGWVDLQADDVADKLEQLSARKKFKGIRHILQGEKQRDFMLRPAFLRGIGQLQKFDLAYDILIYPDQLRYAADFVARFPNQRFVVDHIAKPYIRDKKLNPWREDMQRLASYKNVWCKVSGMVTEANWSSWQKSDFTPYLDTVTSLFGPERLMYGSDWPVCLVAATYGEMLEIVVDYFSVLSTTEQEKIFRTNAIEFYKL